MLLDYDSLMHVDVIPLFVIQVRYPRFPLNEIKAYLLE